MKKVFLYLTAALAACAVLFSCKPKDPQEPETEYPDGAMAKITQQAMINAAAAAYATWEDETVIPETMSVEGTSITKAGTLTLTTPQYQYALAKTLIGLVAGNKDDIIVIGYKAAQHPDRDSYDKDEIPVKGGAALTEGTEDLNSLATRFLAAAATSGTMPNQTLVTRKGADALAFSTNRLTVCLLRALAEYKKSSALPASVTTEYLSAAATLKGFAEQFVQILDIWDETVGTVSADGSHCTDNNSAWENVHFVPIPHSGGAYADGVDQYDVKYQPYFTVTIDGTTYTSAQTWGIALRGIIDLVTTEGSSKMQVNRNPFEHTMGNGASLKEPIPAVIPEDIWGQYPWYESTNDGQPINQEAFSPYLIARCATWFLTRQQALGKIGNFQYFGTDPDNGFVEEGIDGFVSAMRMWLISARFYKYLLDNNITENVYDAVKDVKFATDLYGVEMPDIELKTKNVTLDSQGNAVRASFMAKKEWTASASESWIHVDPASGDAAVEEAVVNITADANTGEERTGTVVIRGGNVTGGLEIAVTQARYVDPSSVTLKEFAQEFVKGLDVWAATVGTVESENKHLIANGTAWENVHFIPIGKTGGEYDDHPGNQHDDKYTPWTLNVGGTQYTSAQAWEIAVRGLLDMVLTDGQDYISKMTSRNKPGYTLGDYKAFSEIMTVNPSQYAIWGNYPWYEEDGATYNGEAIKEVGVDVVTKATLGHLVRGLVGIPGVFDPLGKIGNFQEFGTSDSSLILEGYSGLISPMRELILMMRVYKYLLDNNIDKNVYSAIKDVKFDYDMYGQDVPETPDPTIADFAKEFAKVAETWDKTVGTVTYTYDGTEYKHENVHYVPADFTITLNGTNYNKYQMHEIALNALKALEGGAALTDPITAPGSYKDATAPYHEYNNPLQETEAGLDLLDNFATRCLSYIKNNGEWPNVCGYPRTADPALTTYNGYVSLERNLLMLSRLCKYMVDNNVTSVASLANVKVSTDLWGENVPVGTSLKTFAQEFVKGLDVWAATTGDVDADGIRNQNSELGAWKNVHFIPIVGHTGGDYYNLGNNQYDYTKYTPWVLTVDGVQYSSSQAWEIAIRGLMDMCTAEGDAFLADMTDRNKQYTLQDNLAFSKAVVRPTAEANQWGKYPWYEYDNLVKDGENDIESVGIDFMIKVGSWHVVRSFVKNSGNNPLGMIGNFQEFGTKSSQLNLGNYSGYISPMRELMVLMRIYKYLLDNNVDANIYTAIKDQKFDFDLYGTSLPEGATIGAFAKEYVKILDVWEKTTGTINYLTGEAEGSDYLTDVRDAHYVPSSTTITVAGKTYTTGEMLELAERSYLLLRGMDGNQTSGGLGKFAEVEKATFSTALPESHGASFGPASFNEHGTTYAGKKYNGNCGPLRMGDPNTADGKACSVKLDILDNFAQRHVNWPLTHDNIHSNMCGYCERLDGYYGCFSAQRALVTYAFFFKYMLDNNLTDVSSISDDTVFRSENLGSEHDDYGAGATSIKAFADAYIKALNIWFRTTGTINYLTGETLEGSDYDASLDNKDAHYIPGATTITINGDNSDKKTFTTGDLLEIGERAYLLLRGMDGNQTEGGLGKFATVAKAKMTDEMPASHGTTFGPASFNETGTTSAGNVTTGNGGHLRMGDPNTADGKACSVKFDILDNFAQRHVNWPMTHDGVHSNMCGYIGRLDGYYGCFCAQRALVTYGFFFEYLVKNGLQDVSSIPEDTIFRSEEFGDES